MALVPKGWDYTPAPSSGGVKVPEGWNFNSSETEEERRAREEAERGVGTLTGRATPPSVVDDTLNRAPAEQTTQRLGLDRPATADEIAANKAAEASHEGDSWGEIATKFKERLGPLFTQAGAGFVEAMAEQGVLANPDIMATLPGNEGKSPSQIVMEERAKGLVPGQKMYAAATADLEANAYNSGDSTWKYYVPQVAESIVQMLPGVVASIATRNPFIAGASMAGQVGAQQYGESAQEGRSPEAALVDATWNGAAEAIGEEIPVGMLMKPGGKFLANTLKTAGAEGLQEMFTQVLQTGYDKAVIHPDMTWGEALKQITDAGIVGAAMGGTLHVAAHPVVSGMDALRNRRAAPVPEVAPVAPLTDDDLASPLPDTAIQAGKTVMADLLGENPVTGEKIPGASPLDHLVEKPGRPKDNLNPTIVAGLIKRGIPEIAARGAAAGVHAEAASNPNALNESSGAMGLGQWLGPRKAEIIRRYGPNPTIEQQLDFLAYELKGGDSGGAAVLGSKSDTEALHNYITAFMRPAAGAETTGDLERGMAALGRGGEGITPDSGEPGALGETDTFANDLIASVGANKETPEDMLKRVLGEDVLEPKQGQRVDVTQGDQTVPGTVEDVWERDGRQGVRIKQDDGTIFDEALDDARKYGARITEPVTQSESLTSETPEIGGQTEPAPNIKGEAVGNGFHRFTDDSGHIGIARHNMPQIKAEHRGAMVNFLAGRGITSEQVEVPARDLKPSQSEFSPDKVQQAKEFEGGDRAILISADGYVVDGHHQWLAARDEGKTVRAIQLNAPIRDVLDAAAHMPSAGVSEGSGNQDDSTPQGNASIEDTTSGKGIAITGASAEQMAAITRALPKAKGVPRKDGAIVYSKKYEAQIREALGTTEESVPTAEAQPEETSSTNPPPDFAGAVNRDLSPDQVHAAAAIFDNAEKRGKGETPEQRARALAVRMVREGKDTAGFTAEGDNYSFGQKVRPMQPGPHMTPGKVHVELAGDRGKVHTFNESDIRKEAAEAERSPHENATAPEHVTTGVDDRELGEIANEFNAAQKSMIAGGDELVSHIFDAPKKGEIVRLNDNVKVYQAEHGWMTPAEAKAKIAEWKAHAQAQGKAGAARSENSQKVVLSLFDLSGEWSRPWEEAGYQVYRFDIQNDPEVGDVNNFSREFFSDWFGDFDGQEIYAILAACPCTDFATSGARHFAAKDSDGRTVASVKLVHQTLAVIEHFKPAVWALENPVGRIEKLGGLPPWRLSFDPNHIGDPYTKKTLLWGRFNGNLPIAPVEPTEGSKMFLKYGGKSQATKNARSVTPEGFSYGFFMANNAVDHPAMAVANKFDRLDRALIEKAIAAGVTPDEIETAVEDHYYQDLDDEAANQAIRDLITPPATAAPNSEIEIGDKLAGGTPVAEAAAAARKREYGASNKLVTQDRAAELRDRLKAKLNPNRLNAGIDPEIVAIGTELAVFHIEAGARRFVDFAKAVAADLEQPLEGLRKYLRGWYNGARDMMEDHGESVAGMDTADEVAKAMRTFADWATEPKATVSETSETSETALPADQKTVNAIAQRLLDGDRFASITEARKAISEITGEPIKAGTAQAKQADEAIEAAVVFAAQKITARNEGDPHKAYRELVDLYDRQPNLGVRSSTSIEQQAYSTPVPLGYLASRRAGINQETRVYEPTAGNGSLLIDARATYVTANELNPDRARQLRMLYRGATVTENDAMKDTLAPKQFDAVIANPPFGPLKDESGENQVFDLGSGYKTREIDHAIAIKALEKMKDDGRAVLLVGGIRKLLEGKAREDAYNGKAKREFYYRLYSEYNVTDHFTVNGDLYAKQGAQWPVDVIVIDGRGKSKLPLPAVQAPRVLNDWNALEAEVDGRSSVQSPTGEQAGNPAVESPEPARSDGRDRGGSRERGPDRLEQPAEPSEPGAVRERPPVGEPGSAGLAEQPAGNDAAAPQADRDRASSRASDVKRAPIEGENARQVTYHPASGTQSLDTLVPVNMQTAISKALGNLEQRVGSVDNFVADRLGYKQSEIAKYFSAEQVDALALGISNMEKGSGFIIGDQTGIGKGRVVAGIIRYAMQSGRMPIFVTEKPTLYADMYRDMSDIGIPEMLGRPVNIVMTNANEKVPLTEDGSEVLKTPPAAQHNALLGRIADGDREGVDVLFTTYAQMQSIKGAWTARQRAIQRLADGSILIFDESHNAGGQGQNKPAPKKKSGDDETATDLGAPNRAQFARQIAKAAHGVFFSSATYAKRPEVMDLYASTDMKYAVADIDNLAAAISKGGIPMQQVVASMLAEAGQYIRRERSFEGVDYRTPAVEVSREAYSQFTAVLRAIQNFQEDHIKDVVQGISEDIRTEAKSVSHDGSVGSAGATSTNFTSVMHNIVEQMLLALKAEPAAKMAIEAIENGQKPVITLANTMGSFLEEYAEEHSIGNGQPMPLDFRSLLHRYLDRTRRITMRKPFSSEKAEVHIITDDELGPVGLAAFEAAQRQIDRMDLSDMPVSPIDYIRNRIRSAGYKVGEITGRSSTLDYAGDVPTYRIRPGKETSIQGKRDAIVGFNDGRIDDMILNQSGSTGISLHASEKFKDQRPRRMIIAQAERNIDTHMQILGRVHRTGQVVLPSYDQLVAAVPAEMRPAAVLSKKMASLNANTTGARDSALTGEDVPDFMNEYGDEIAARMMEEDPQLHDLLGTPLKESGDEEEGLSREDAARKVTGRLMLLPLEEQEAFYEQFLSDYRDYLEQKEAAGEATLEAKTLELDARQLDRQQVIAPTNPNSPFGEGVYRENLDVKLLGKPLKPAGIIAEIANAIGKKPEGEDHGAALTELAQAGREWNRDMVDSYTREFDGYRRNEIDKLDDDKKRGPMMDRLRANEAMFKGLMATVHPGAVVMLENDGVSIPGIVMAVEKKGERKNPLALGAFRATIAVADAAQRITVPFSQLRPLHAEESPGTFQVQPIREIDGQPPFEAFENMQREAREKRTMFTGNILAAYEHTTGQGQIVNFVRDDGSVEPGLMMKRGYNYEKEIEKKPVSFRTPEQVMEWVNKGEIAFDAGNGVKVEKIGSQLVVTAAASKAQGGQYFLNTDVRRTLGDDFYKKSTGMVGTTSTSNMREVIEALMRAGAVFTAKTNFADAREIVAGEEAQPQPEGRARIEPQQSWAEALKGRDDELRAALEAQLRQFGIEDRIALDVGRKLNLTQGSASGQSWNGVISVALDKARDPSATLSHETIHAMRDLGLFTPAEWRSLQTAAWENPATRGWAQQHYGNRGLSLDDLKEEAAAEHFANHWRSLTRPKSLWGRALDRIARFVAALGHAVNTLLGRQANPEFVARLVQDKILSGEIGARATGEGMLPRGGAQRTFGKRRDMVVHHGSPHEFDEFSTDKIGTGEGAQAYGWGLYFTDRKGIAEHYRDKLKGRQRVVVKVDGKTHYDLVREYGMQKYTQDMWDALEGLGAVETAGSVEDALDNLQNRRGSVYDYEGAKAWIEAHRDQLTVEKPGRLYTVDIPEADKYLLWDKPLSEQPEAVKVALGRAVPEIVARREGGGTTAADVQVYLNADQGRGGAIYERLARYGGQQAASLALHEAGVTGIKYLDGTSRASGEGSFNYVLFDGGDAKIVAREQVEARAAEFDDEATEERWAEARRGIGGDGGPSLVATASAWWDDLKNGFTRHWRDLPNEARFSDVMQQFRKLEAAPEAAKDASVRYLKNLVGKMDKAEYDLFSRKVVLDDLSWEASAEHDLPFGFTPESLKVERAKIDALVDQNEKLVEALRVRKAHNRKIADDMVEAGVLTAEQIKNPAYYRHMVLDYARHESRIARQKGPKQVKSPYWARRMGSVLDINANLLEAEFDWLQKAQIDIATADVISKLKASSHNIRETLRNEARDKNREALAARIKGDEELEAEDLHFRQMIARGFDIVTKAIEAGDVGDIPPHLERAANQLAFGGAKGEPPFALFAWLLDNQKPGAMGAGMVLKYSGLRKQWVRKLLGERYYDPDDVDALVKRLKPEGYKAWQPREGRHFFTSKTISESALDMFVGKLAETVYPGVERDELHKALTTIRPQLVVGGDRYTMVLPNEIADTLTEFGNRRTEGMVAQVFSGIQSAWKRWVLINPRRFLKYNINNMSGDLDAIIAGNPGTLGKVKRAWGELRSAAKGEASDRYREALERGVFTSGLSINEIPDINRLSAVRHLTEDRSKLNQFTIGAVAGVWRALQDSTQFRENLFRMAAYLDYVEKIESGKPQLEIGYGASVPTMVDAVKDSKDKAAMLARDLVGDYGSISVAGSWLRRYLVPFWSWMEINTRRYWRLTSNAFSESKAKGIATGGLLGVGVAGRTAAWMAVRMGMVYGLLYLWNHLLFGDEEDDLGELQQRQLHLILGRDPTDGSVITLRTQGALSDVLGEFGFPDAMAGLKRWQDGQGTIGQAIKDTLKAPVNRVATSMTPLFQEPIEQAMGQELWPDIFAPRVIHDRVRHVASDLSLENEYDMIAGKPSRGYGRSWTESVLYKRDPGEMAYDTAKGIAYDWLANVKGQAGFSGTSPRSEALRDYRLAMRYGDDDAAIAALKRYAEFEGTTKGLKASLRSQHPLGPIAKKDRAAFLESLTDEQLETFAEAEQWYNRVYLNKEPAKK